MFLPFLSYTADREAASCMWTNYISVYFAEVIDLTHDNKDDLQAAIALSLLESPKIQADGRDLNRLFL
jgi:hypothetical protein